MPSTPGSATTLKARAREQRFEVIEELLRVIEPAPKSTLEIVAEIMRRFSISERVAYRDIREVWNRRARDLAATREAQLAEADHEWRRREALADQRGETQAGNFALDRRHRLHGLYAPTKVQVSGSVGVHAELAIRIDALIGVLDEHGREALDVVLEQLDRARAAGLLPEPSEREGDRDSGGTELEQ